MGNFFYTITNKFTTIMKSLNLLAGFGGALVLTVLNESLKNLDTKMPRIDLVGEEAIQKTSAFLGSKIKSKKTLYKTTLAGDLLSNAAYYSLIGGNKKNLWKRAASAGFLAGLGAVTLPKEMGLDDTPVTKSLTTKTLTIGYYMAGALVTAGIMSMINKE